MSKSTEWYETFFDGLYAQVLGSERHEEKAPAEARMIKRLLKLRKGKRVLDCPCGFGRIAFQLAKLGLDVTGADLTASYIRRAKSQAANVRFLRCDMRELPFDSEFDSIVNWFTSFGYFDEVGNLATAHSAFTALKPGGKFLIEMINKSELLTRFTPRGDDEANGIRIVRRSRWDATNSRVFNTWVFSKGKRTERHRFSHQLYIAGGMRSLLRRVGFRNIRFFGRPPLGRFTRHSRRMIAIASRPVK